MSNSSNASIWNDFYERQFSDPYFLFPWHKDEYEQITMMLRRKSIQVLLLSGFTLTGLFKLSNMISISLLCEKFTSCLRPCGNCVSCGWVRANTHPDFKCLISNSHLLEFLSFCEAPEVSGKHKSNSGISVEDIRDLSRFFFLSTHRGRRVVFIAPIESLSDNALQSLLKTLEEPISDTIFVLMSYSPHRLQATLLSRCQIHFRVPSPEESVVASWLSSLLGSKLPFSSSVEQVVLRRPFYALLLIVTETEVLLADISHFLCSNPFNLCSMMSSCKLLLQKWDKLITNQQSISTLLNLLIDIVRIYVNVYIKTESHNLSAKQRGRTLLAWLRFIDRMRDACLVAYTPLNYELLLEHVMVSHPFIR